MLTLSRLIDKIAELTGKAGALVLPLLVLTILLNVFLRYVFNIGLIELGAWARNSGFFEKYPYFTKLSVLTEN